MGVNAFGKRTPGAALLVGRPVGVLAVLHFYAAGSMMAYMLSDSRVSLDELCAMRKRV